MSGADSSNNSTAVSVPSHTSGLTSSLSVSSSSPLISASLLANGHLNGTTRPSVSDSTAAGAGRSTASRDTGATAVPDSSLSNGNQTLFGIDLRTSLTNSSSQSTSQRQSIRTDLYASMNESLRHGRTVHPNVDRIASSRPPIRRPFIRALHHDDSVPWDDVVSAATSAADAAIAGPSSISIPSCPPSAIHRTVPNEVTTISLNEQLSDATERQLDTLNNNSVWSEISHLVGRLSGVRGQLTSLFQ